MIEVIPLRAQDLPALARLWTQALTRQGPHCSLSAHDIEEHVLLHGGEPRAILAIDPRGWLAAHSDGELVGFAHCTVGRWLQDHPEILRGILRAMVLASEAPSATGSVLLRAADAYFRTNASLADIVAFHPYSGYPLINQGRGALMHEEWTIMDAMGQAGYRLASRWLYFHRSFTALIPEQLPQIPGLKLSWERSSDLAWGLRVQLQGEPIAEARFMPLPQSQDCPLPRSAALYHIEVTPAFHRQGIGRWLLQRGMNHLITLGFDRLLIDAPHEDALLQSRLFRLQFREQSQRGYTYEKPHA